MAIRIWSLMSIAMCFFGCATHDCGYIIENYKVVRNLTGQTQTISVCSEVRRNLSASTDSRWVKSTIEITEEPESTIKLPSDSGRRYTTTSDFQGGYKDMCSKPEVPQQRSFALTEESIKKFKLCTELETGTTYLVNAIENCPVNSTEQASSAYCP